MAIEFDWSISLGQVIMGASALVAGSRAYYSIVNKVELIARDMLNLQTEYRDGKVERNQLFSDVNTKLAAIPRMNVQLARLEEKSNIGFPRNRAHVNEHPIKIEDDE